MKSLLFIAALGLALAMPICSAARQEQQSPPPPRKKIPSLTTEDVMRSGKVEAVEAPPEATGKKPAPDAKAPEGEKKPDVSPEEKAWRANVKSAREHAETAQRAAEEAELKVTDLRNQLGAPGQDPRDRNALVAEMEQVTESVEPLKNEAREAKTALQNLLDEGRDKGYHEDAGPGPTTADGKPNDSYYKNRFDKLTQQLQDAQRRVQLYEDRIRDINERITMNSRTGDNYFIGKLQQDRDEAQQNLQDAQAARDKAQQEVDALMEEARTAGVPPGVFR